ncbi:hypothetical protein [Pararhizobium arenae]|uniref:hypothetical protein n=1 Tax=Pararhizobium arenae TaxID=1856850 RepID=UPI0009F9E846|nr:hypothetical protein [Pararhizobium arenae]
MQVSTVVSPVAEQKSGLKSIVFSPTFFLIAVTFVLLPLALVKTIPIPLGAMFWDQYLYIDAANRIADGQVPAIDFFAPVGALGYYLFAGWLKIFPEGAILLLASWSLLAVTAPSLALVLYCVQKRSRATAWALLLPFLLFSILPFNTAEFYPFPGTDGFGIYNRQICQLLYVLAAALCFLRAPALLGIVVTLTMLALLFVKVTGVVSGVLLCLMAFAAGRLPLRVAIAAGLAFFLSIGLIEITTGVVSAYAEDMIALLVMNDTSLLPRLLQGASINFGIMASAAGLAVVLLVSDRHKLATDWKRFRNAPGFASAAQLLDQNWLWLAVFLLAGLLFESQNTGSQAFIFLWPLILSILIRKHREDGTSTGLMVAGILALAAMLPPVVEITQRAARSAVGSVNDIVLQHRNLKTLGTISLRPVFATRAERMHPNYIAHRETYEEIVRNGELPANLLYSDFDFFWLWMQTMDDAIDAIKAYEADHGMRFDTIMSIDFSNPFPWLMDRRAPHAIAIGADPFRAVPPPDDKVAAAVAAVDLALLPTCPPTTARWSLLGLYEPFLKQGHTRIKLTSCYDAFVRDALVNKQ